MTYAECVHYLYSLGNELKPGAKFDLARINIVLEELGSPHAGQRFVHVAGTNGKGSTCAMIANSLIKAGHRTGLYTSPHLIEPTERIQINGIPISPAEFVDAFEIVHAAAEKLLALERLDAHPSYFETVTAMAFIVFKAKCDIAVLEVGLGGRLDATNVVTPQLCVITPISYDHEAFLGSTIEAIASEKAGILKPGVPVVMAAQLAPVEQVIESRAHELGCELIRSADIPASDVHLQPRAGTFCFESVRFECALPGRHQIENAKTAILACRHIGLPIATIQEGLRTARWPGRLEYVASDPDFVLDGAHNPAGAGALADYIREFCSHRPVWLVYGAMRDKAVEEIAEKLFPLAERVIVTAPNFPRALRPETIVSLTACTHCTIANSVREAIDVARTAPRNAIVFFTGSLFLVGEARALLTAQPPPVS